jgi:hypothetical protein
MDSKVMISEVIRVPAELEIFSRILLYLGKYITFFVP